MSNIFGNNPNMKSQLFKCYCGNEWRQETILAPNPEGYIERTCDNHSGGAEQVLIVIKEPNKPARADMMDNTLEGIQSAVGGYVERHQSHPFEGYSFLVNEEPSFDSKINIRFRNTYFVGNVLVTKEEGVEFISLTEEEAITIIQEMNKL